MGFNYSQTKIFDGEIYLVLFEREFMFKRVFKEANGILVLTSMNEARYPEKRLQENYGGFKVIGKQCFRLG